MSARSLLVVPGFILALTVTGCGGIAEPLVPVAGKVLIDGKTLDGVVVTFIPEVKVQGRLGGTGTTDSAGTFTVTNLDQNKPGLPPGKYTVAYSRRRLPDGTAAPEDRTNADPGMILVETLPTYLVTPNPKYPATQVVISEGGNQSLELKASRKLSPALMGPG